MSSSSCWSSVAEATAEEGAAEEGPAALTGRLAGLKTLPHPSVGVGGVQRPRPLAPDVSAAGAPSGSKVAEPSREEGRAEQGREEQTEAEEEETREASPEPPSVADAQAAAVGGLLGGMSGVEARETAASGTFSSSEDSPRADVGREAAEPGWEVADAAPLEPGRESPAWANPGRESDAWRVATRATARAAEPGCV